MSTSLRGTHAADGARPSARVCELGNGDRRELIALVDADPLVNVVVASRIQAFDTFDPRTFGGTLLGVRDCAGQLRAAAFSGGNLLPVGGRRADWLTLAAAVRARRQVCTSIVGRVDAVETMWSVLAPHWGPARATRPCQPLLFLERGDPLPPTDARVRVVRPADLDAYLPASAAMFTGELGVSPLEAGGLREYRRRLGALLEDGRAFAVFDDDGAVVFKADFGAVSAQTCQVQGVWVRPDRRGQGIGTSALATVLRHGLQLAPTVSLYVNDFNDAALRMYARLGMRVSTELATILF